MKPWNVTATSEKQTDRIQFFFLLQSKLRPASLQRCICRRTRIPQINGIGNKNYCFCFGRKMRYVRRNSVHWTVQTDNIWTVANSSTELCKQTKFGPLQTAALNCAKQTTFGPLQTAALNCANRQHLDRCKQQHWTVQTDNIWTVANSSIELCKQTTFRPLQTAALNCANRQHFDRCKQQHWTSKAQQQCLYIRRMWKEKVEVVVVVAYLLFNDDFNS